MAIEFRLWLHQGSRMTIDARGHVQHPGYTPQCFSRSPQTLTTTKPGCKIKESSWVLFPPWAFWQSIFSLHDGVLPYRHQTHFLWATFTRLFGSSQRDIANTTLLDTGITPRVVEVSSFGNYSGGVHVSRAW